ncbi:hypothetical protein GGX14DRAFT_382956 [Mycena pura]|uniref:Uncharacterized protein n=1 Tax=Mycena pura TaxID=153505 RepID=A0AAD6UNX1_9AGAR|nr:hypothetical protein GGX14DRAFT_382956 [Mycena pura]
MPPPQAPSLKRPQQRTLFLRSSDSSSYRPSAPQDISLNIAEKIFPPVERGSGQLQGETIHEFLARRKADNEQRMKEESPAAKERRLQREATAATGEPPSLHGKHKTQVFIWDMAENFDGIFYIRRQYNRRLAQERWDEFAPTQRIYDGFSNAWDFCEALDLDAEAGNDGGMDYDDGDDDYDFGDSGSSHSFFPHVSADAPGREHIQNIFGQRYGLLSSSVAPSGAKQMSQSAVRYAVGDRFWKAPDAVPVLLQATIDSENLQALPPSLSDLNSLAADLHQKDWPVRVKKLTYHARTVYVFCPDESDEPFVKLDDAASVLHCIRSGWRNTAEIVRELTRIGAEFFPAWHRSTSRDADDPAWVPPLGVRPAGYNGTQNDYRAYVERRDDFLRSSRGCVALFHGGIVARIARMVIENFEDRACARPSDIVLDVAVRFADLDGGSLWHEALTPSEIDLICGVYKVATGASIYLPRQALTFYDRAEKRNPGEVSLVVAPAGPFLLVGFAYGLVERQLRDLVSEASEGYWRGQGPAAYDHGVEIEHEVQRSGT